MARCATPDVGYPICEIFKKAEPSIKSTPRGIVTDSRAEPENAYDAIRFSRESFSNEIHESDQQHEKHDEQRDSAFRGMMMIDVIGRLSKERWRLAGWQQERGRRLMTEQ
jgi:hypothetical protein